MQPDDFFDSEWPWPLAQVRCCRRPHRELLPVAGLRSLLRAALMDGSKRVWSLSGCLACVAPALLSALAKVAPAEATPAWRDSWRQLP